MVEKLDDVKRKVRGLLATAAEGSGATDPERATARRLADQLLLAHGLTTADLTPPRPLPRITVTVQTNTTTGWAWTFHGPPAHKTA